MNRRSQIMVNAVGGVKLRQPWRQARLSTMIFRRSGPHTAEMQYMASRKFEIRGNLDSAYADVFTSEALAALDALAGLDTERKAVMTARMERRLARARNKQRIMFLDP